MFALELVGTGSQVHESAAKVSLTPVDCTESREGFLLHLGEGLGLMMGPVLPGSI